MSSVEGVLVLEATDASVAPLTTAIAAEPATPTFDAPTPEMAVVEIRQPMPSSSPGFPNLFASISVTVSKSCDATALPFVISSAMPDWTDGSDAPIASSSMNSGSFRISPRLPMTESISSPIRAFAVSNRWPLFNCSISARMTACFTASF